MGSMLKISNLAIGRLAGVTDGGRKKDRTMPDFFAFCGAEIYFQPRLQP